jgi:hypothetical protein
MSHLFRPVTVSFAVAAPPEEVFEFVADTRNDPIWCHNVSDVEQTAGEGVDVGSRFRFHQTVETGGRTLESAVDVEVVEMGEGAITWKVGDRFQEREVRLEVVPDGEGSTVRQTTVAGFRRPPGLARWLYPMLARKTFKDQLERLAEHFE